MENQHRHIAGYRELSAEEIALMNEAKALAAQVGDFIGKLRERGTLLRANAQGALPSVEAPPNADPRWLSIAQTQLQQGFMALTRSIAQPTTF